MTSVTLEKFVADLGDESKPLKHAGLLQLTSLESEDVFGFRSAWVDLPKTRKTEILGKLVELGENNMELDFSAIFRVCLNDEDDDVRELATRGLWECDDRVVVRPLIGLLKNDPSEKVRAAAALSLSKFSSMAQDGKLLGRDADRVRDALLNVVGKEDENIEVRRRAIEAVSCFNTPEIEGIVREAYGSENPRLRQSAIFAMGKSADSQWLGTVLKETRHEDPAMRFEAANACGLLGDETIVPHLISLFKDDDVEVQVAALQALGQIGGQLAKRALQKAVKTGDETVEEAAQAALAEIEFDEDPLGFRSQS